MPSVSILSGIGAERMGLFVSLRKIPQSFIFTRVEEESRIIRSMVTNFEKFHTMPELLNEFIFF